MKIIIAGGRDFNDFKLLSDTMRELLEVYPNMEVVSGGNKTWNTDLGCHTGADYLGEQWAAIYKIPVTKFPANWRLFGKAAGPIRNQEMADYADILVAFWDEISKGTHDMINRATLKGLRVTIVKY